MNQTNSDFIHSLREYADWAEGNIWEVPITLPDVLRQAADLIEAQGKPILKSSNIFDQEEIHENCTVQVLKNSVTGECSVGWWKNP